MPGRVPLHLRVGRADHQHQRSAVRDRAQLRLWRGPLSIREGREPKRRIGCALSDHRSGQPAHARRPAPATVASNSPDRSRWRSSGLGPSRQAARCNRCCRRPEADDGSHDCASSRNVLSRASAATPARGPPACRSADGRPWLAATVRPELRCRRKPCHAQGLPSIRALRGDHDQDNRVDGRAAA